MVRPLARLSRSSLRRGIGASVVPARALSLAARGSSLARLQASAAASCPIHPRRRDVSYASQTPVPIALPTVTKITSVAPSSGPISGVDAVVIGVASTTEAGPRLVGDAQAFAGDRAATLAGQLGKLGFKGKSCSVLALPGAENDPAPVLLFVGLGEEPEQGFKPETLRRAAGAATRAAGAAEHKTVAVILPTTTAETLAAVTEGASLGAYAWTAYKTKDTTTPVAAIQIVTAGDAEVVRRAEVTARRVKNARELVNIPGSDLFPSSFAQHVVESAKGIEGVKVEVWDENKLRAEKMGGLVGVGQGSVHPPRLVKVAYTPSNANAKHLSIVGKGITFDTGGISLKPSPKMWEMKGDMGGAAATVQAVLAAAELKVPVRVTGWLCLAENMPSGTALKNGDVIRQRTGTTVEVHNTDAEGRLVLADGLAVAQASATGYGTEDAEPDLLLDIATLTGAQMAALGTRTAGLMGDDKAIKAVERAAAASGEPFWAMPFPEELLEDMKSTTADLKNIGSVPYGGMLKAGVFVSTAVLLRGFPSR